MAETLINPNESQNQDVDKPTPLADRQKQNAQLKKIIGWTLSILMVALTVYVLLLQNQNYRTLNTTTDLLTLSTVGQAANYRSYVQQYRETKEQLEETTRKLASVQKQLDDVTLELASTKGILSDTQAQLAAVQEENAKLKQEIMQLEGLRTAENVQSIPELEAKISALKQKNAEVTSQLAGVKNELRAFEADFSNVKEGKSLIALFKNKINLVKSRMRYLKQEAYFARVAAQKEKDRIAALNGNNGFLIKDGQPQKKGNAKGFAIDVKIVQ